MCLRCGVVEYPYRSCPSGPAGPGDYGSPPDASPAEYGAAPTAACLGWARWDRGRAIGGNILTRLRVIR
jgi:hypothetical protein